ncbi:uncharacterized protein LOC122957972 [Acropora millepora]|uniref:uncharacterized protein LOC122957972 n=1 Tax=Acropora millepora TaxID=45264 RepID=UPI001CF2BAD9|nr:uncharacterized protein LOC122957972 [Acropora millepora]
MHSSEPLPVASSANQHCLVSLEFCKIEMSGCTLIAYKLIVSRSPCVVPSAEVSSFPLNMKSLAVAIELSLSPVQEHGDKSDSLVDITGVSDDQNLCLEDDNYASIALSAQEVNPNFASFEGNPFPDPIERASDDDDDDDGSCTYESNSSSDSSSEVESGTDIRSDESFVSDDLTIRSPSSPSESATLTALELDVSSLNQTRSENTMESSTFTTDVMSALSFSDARSSESVEQYLLEPSASSLVHAEAAVSTNLSTC